MDKKIKKTIRNSRDLDVYQNTYSVSVRMINLHANSVTWLRPGINSRIRDERRYGPLCLITYNDF